MADAVRGLKVKLGADTAAFNRAMDRSRKKTNDLGKLMKKAFTAGAVIAAASQIVQANVEMEKSLDSLQAITGATDQDMQFYAKSAQAVGPATKRSASDIVKAFELVGSAKPELLGSKEALTAVTKEAATLANAAGMKMEPAVDAATKVMNQFEIGASGASRVVNALAAASKAGAAPVNQVAESVKKSGTVAKAAKVSLEQHVGMIETLAEKGIVGAEAGTNLRNVLLTLQTGADDTNPAVVGLSTALENLSAKNLSAAEMSKIFGKENVVAAQILAQNVDKVKHYTSAVTDTNVANEQAAIQTGNVASAWEGLKSATGSAFLQLQKGTGPLRNVIEGMSSLVLKVSGVKDETTLFLNEQARLARENKAQVSVTNTLVKSFEELTAKENLSGDEKIRLQGIVQALRSDIGENAVTLNTETGEYELNTQAVKDNLQAKLDLATGGEAALIKKAAELTKQQNKYIKANEDAHDSVADARKVVESYADTLASVGIAQKDITTFNFNELSKTALDALNNTSGLSDETVEAYKALQTYIKLAQTGGVDYGVSKQVSDELRATIQALVSTGLTVDEARAKVNQYIESEKALTDEQKAQIDKYEALTGKQIGYTTALTDAQVAEMKAVEDKNKTSAALSTEGLTLGEISTKLSELKKQRNEAHGPAEIAAIDAEIAKYESLADSIELAVSKMKTDSSVFTMEPKTLDVIPGTAEAPDVDNPPPLEMNTIGGISLGTDIDALIELQRQFEIITQKNNIYGDSLSATQQKIAATEQAIASFIERQIQSGGAFDATNPQLLELINNLQVLQEVADNLDLSENMASQVESINQIIDQGIKNIAINMGMIIGEIAAGSAGLSDVWGVLLSGAADMAINLGKLAIQNGIAIEAIKKSLFNLQGIGAIAAGVALIALGSFVKNKAASIAGGGKSGGGAVPGLAEGGVAKKPSLVMIGEYPGAESDPEIVAPESKMRGVFSEVLSGLEIPEQSSVNVTAPVNEMPAVNVAAPDMPAYPEQSPVNVTAPANEMPAVNVAPPDIPAYPEQSPVNVTAPVNEMPAVSVAAPDLPAFPEQSPVNVTAPVNEMPAVSVAAPDLPAFPEQSPVNVTAPVNEMPAVNVASPDLPAFPEQSPVNVTAPVNEMPAVNVAAPDLPAFPEQSPVNVTAPVNEMPAVSVAAPDLPAYPTPDIPEFSVPTLTDFQAPTVPQLPDTMPVSLPSSQQMNIQQTVKLTGDFKVRGSDLLLAIDESTRRRERI